MKIQKHLLNIYFLNCGLFVVPHIYLSSKFRLILKFTNIEIYFQHFSFVMYGAIIDENAPIFSQNIHSVSERFRSFRYQSILQTPPWVISHSHFISYDLSILILCIQFFVHSTFLRSRIFFSEFHTYGFFYSQIYMFFFFGFFL